MTPQKTARTSYPTRKKTRNEAMRALKKILAAALIISCAIASLVSCNRKYDEDEVISAAGELIKKSAVLEDILFGEGFGIDLSDTNIGYKKADAASVKSYSDKLGISFTDINGLRSVISSVYTAGYANDIFSGVLYGNPNFKTRYYQDGDAIMVDTTYKKLKKDEITYHYETLKVSDVNGEKITVSLDITIKTSDGKSQNRNISVDMIEDASGWKIDTPTYAVYNENYDKYKDLENELNKK